MSRSAVVIEDDIRIGELVRLLVEKCGFQVELERDGARGLQQVRNRRPDLVITDMLLPGLHGLDICKAIRSDPQLKHAKIIAMTAVFRSRQFQLDARGVRFDSLIEKPFDIKQLRDEIRKLFPGTCKQSDGAKLKGNHASEQIAPVDLRKAVSQLARRWEQYRIYPDRRELLNEMLADLGRLTGMTAFDGDRTISEVFAEMDRVIRGFVKNRGAILKSEANRLDQGFRQLNDTLGMSEPVQRDSADEDRVQAVKPEQETGPALSDLLDKRPDRNICLITDEPERFNNLAKGLGVFGFRMIRTGWDEDGKRACPELSGLLIDLRSFLRDPDSTRLSHVEQLRRHGGADVPAVVLADQPAIPDAIIQELVQHGCWDFYSGPLDAFGLISHLKEIRLDGGAAQDRLLIADDQSLSEYVQIILKAKGFLTETVRSVSEVRSTVDAFRPDLVLVGEGLGRLTAIGLIRYLRSMDPAMPIVIVAETPDDELVQSVTDVGCSDVLPLGLAEDRMALTLRSRMRTYRLNHHGRDYDAVTGALLYSEWLTRFERDRQWSMDRGNPFLCATLQLDNLQDLNRQYGARFADRLLSALVLLLEHQFRNRAVVGRDGGARFNMYVSGLGFRDATELMNRVGQLFASIPFFHGTGTIHASVSVGVAMCQSGESAHQLLFRTGNACRRALSQGGNGVVVLEK